MIFRSFWTALIDFFDFQFRSRCSSKSAAFVVVAVWNAVTRNDQAQTQSSLFALSTMAPLSPNWPQRLSCRPRQVSFWFAKCAELQVARQDHGELKILRAACVDRRVVYIKRRDVASQSSSRRRQVTLVWATYAFVLEVAGDRGQQRKVKANGDVSLGEVLACFSWIGVL